MYKQLTSIRKSEKRGTGLRIVVMFVTLNNFWTCLHILEQHIRDCVDAFCMTGTHL